jgi:hypothetical protein
MLAMCPLSLMLPFLIVLMVSRLEQTRALAIPIPTVLGRAKWESRVIVPAHELLLVVCQGSPTGEDPGNVLLQEELDAMVRPDRLVAEEKTTPFVNRNDDDDNDSAVSNEREPLYNAAPLVSGVIIRLLNILWFLCRFNRDGSTFSTVSSHSMKSKSYLVEFGC